MKCKFVKITLCYIPTECIFVFHFSDVSVNEILKEDILTQVQVTDIIYEDVKDSEQGHGDGPSVETASR